MGIALIQVGLAQNLLTGLPLGNDHETIRWDPITTSWVKSGNILNNTSNVAIGYNVYTTFQSLFTPARLAIRGLTSTASSQSLHIRNTNNIDLLSVRDDGNIGINLNITSIGAKLHIFDGSFLIEGGTDSTNFPIISSTSGRKFFWAPSKIAFRAGDDTLYNWTDLTIGKLSYAFGLSHIVDSEGGAALSGQIHTINSDYSVIGGGSYNSILNNSNNSGIFSGINNEISNSINSTIIGGNNNSLTNAEYTTILNGDSIIGDQPYTVYGTKFNINKEYTFTVPPVDVTNMLWREKWALPGDSFNYNWLYWENRPILSYRETLTYNANDTVLWDDTNKEWYVGVVGGAPIISITYNDLMNLINTNSLIEDQKYLINDFQTIYDQPDYNTNTVEKLSVTTKYSSIEPLLVTATSNSTLSIIVSSILYPDDYIEWVPYYYYDSNTLTKVFTTEVMLQPTKGNIIKRIDINNNETNYDHRTILFKRYQSYTRGLQLTGSSFNVTGINLTGIGTQFLTELNVNDIIVLNNNSPSIAYTYTFKILTITDNFNAILEMNSGLNVNANSAYIGIPTGIYNNWMDSNVIGDWIEVLTFGNGCADNIINTKYNINTNLYFYLPNIVFNNNSIQNKIEYSYNNTFGTQAVFNTINGFFVGNIIGNSFSSNIIGSNFSYNLIGNDFNNNMIGNNFTFNIIENAFSTNVIDNIFTFNVIGNAFLYNNLSINFINQIIGSNVEYNYRIPAIGKLNIITPNVDTLLAPNGAFLKMIDNTTGETDYFSLLTTGNSILLPNEVNIIDSTTSPTIVLPVSPYDGQYFYIKDSGNGSALNTITIDGGIYNIDATNTYIIDSPYEIVKIIWSAVYNQWYIL